jgi:hypothetical protein
MHTGGATLTYTKTTVHAAVQQEPPDALDYSDRWLRYDDEFSEDEVVSGDEGEVIYIIHI